MSLRFLQILKVQLCVIEQFDHHLTDMLVEIMSLESGER